MMDYHSRHGHDIASFDLPSTHRLPTVSAAQALEDLTDGPSQFLSTGLIALDDALRGPDIDGSEDSAALGGIQRGHVTEVWGPPGVGKTTLGLQLAANALQGGDGVVWIDGFHTMCSGRLEALTSRTSSDTEPGDPQVLDKFVHYACPTLPHFLALLCRPSAACIPLPTALVVVDSLSALVNHEFPRTLDLKSASKSSGKGPSVPARRLQVLQYIINALQKLAATRGVSIVVLTQCATRLQADRGATLVPAITASSWEQGFPTRLVLFKDWIWQAGRVSTVHFAAVEKLNGKGVSSTEMARRVVAFTISSGGLVSVKYDSSQSSATLPGIPSMRKRKLGAAGFEITDSDDDEDYGWQDDEDAMPNMPPQWQGSEDLLLGTQRESDGDGEDDQADDEVPDSDDDAEGSLTAEPERG